jgi:hypothetical protein
MLCDPLSELLPSPRPRRKLTVLIDASSRTNYFAFVVLVVHDRPETQAHNSQGRSVFRRVGVILGEGVN